ncbi:MAG TPA: hypothetical protein VM286_03105 [Candidatus Thermoplasmatota archaeon]|nr:hypothetical protein [Candidatus Thermoplasmatota archaeon]
MSLTTRQVGYGLLGLTALTVALTAYMVATADHAMAPIHYAPAAALVAMMAVWPFANGWRPWTSSLPQSCRACGTQWLPGEAQGQCPACGQVSSA